MGQFNSVTSINLAAAHLAIFAAASDQTQQEEKQQDQPIDVYFYTTIAAGAVILFLVYQQLTAKQEFAQQLTLNDATGTENKTANEREQQKDTILKRLDKEGPFERDAYGILTKEAFLHLRRILSEQVLIEFKDKKEELMNQRLAAFQNRDQRTYMTKIQEASQEYLKLLGKKQQQALNFLEISEPNFKSAYEQVMMDPVMKQRLQDEDDQIKMNMEKKDVKESKSEIKAMWLEKLRMEGMLQERMLKMGGQSQQQVQQITLIEKTKILDEIYLKHKVKLHYLMHAVKHYELDKDEDVMTTAQAIVMQGKRAMEAMEKAMELPPDEQEVVLKYAKEVGHVQPDEKGMIPFPAYLSVNKCAYMAVHEMTKDDETEYREKRRKLLLGGKVDEYRLLAKGRHDLGANKQKGALKLMLEKLNIPAQAWLQAGQVYMQNPQAKAALEEQQMRVIEEAMAHDPSKEILSFEKVLQIIEFTENEKLEYIDKVNMGVRSGKIPASNVAMIMEVEKLMQLDSLYLREGIDEWDIQRAFKEHNVRDSPEFKKLTQEILRKAEIKKAQALAANPQAMSAGVAGDPTL